MKKIIAGLVLMAAAGGALAYTPGDAEELNARVKACKNYADLGDLYYRMAVAGKRPQMHDTGWSEPMRQHIEDEIFTNVGSYDRQSAAQMAGTYCLDNIIRYSHGVQD